MTRGRGGNLTRRVTWPASCYKSLTVIAKCKGIVRRVRGEQLIEQRPEPSYDHIVVGYDEPRWVTILVEVVLIALYLAVTASIIITGLHG